MKLAIIGVSIFFCLPFLTQNDTILHHHKFPNGRTSTIIVLKDNREGYAKAFDFEGKEIYNSYIRRFGGHASVTFKHHPNGMVKEAHYSSHPDGGIQWYNTYTSFDEYGNKLSERNYNWDDKVTIPHHFKPDSLLLRPPATPHVSPVVQPPIKHEPIVHPQLPKKEVVRCAAIHKNTTLFVNHSRTKILLSINYQGKDTIILLKPHKTFQGPTYLSAQISSPMSQNVGFKSSCMKKECIIDSTIEVIRLGELETQHRVHLYSRKKSKP
jgi:hypothetical protein